MGNDGLKSSSKNHHQQHNSRHNNTTLNNQLSKDDDDIELPKPQRRFDKIRRSLSLRKKKNKQPAAPIQAATTTTAAATTTNATEKEKYTIDASKPTSWQDDERRVREGTCSFHVKYLGSIEVFDSRGMHICEQAIERQISVSFK